MFILGVESGPPDDQTSGDSGRVLIVSASVGAGHDGAAHELSQRLVARGVHVETRDFLDALPAWIGFSVREGYTGSVNHTPWFYDWLYAAMERRGVVRLIGLLVCRLGARRVLRWCADSRADAVVSTYPLASQALGQMVARGRLAIPTATFLTDPSVHALWVNQNVHRHLTTLPATAEIGERDYDTPMTVVGPLVPPHFARRLPADRKAALLGELGIPPDRPIALVVTGSLGLGDVTATVNAVVATGVATPLVLCGRNDRLLRELNDRAGVLAVGWRDDVPDLMQIADVLVHNAGGLSFSESLVAGLPAVTYACIPGHGKANGQVLTDSGIAPLAHTIDELRSALEQQLRPQARAALRSSLDVAVSDASQVIIEELGSQWAPAMLKATLTRRRRRTALRRRVGGIAAATLLAVASLGATEGVSTAAGHGFGVATMPASTAALVIQPSTLADVAEQATLLERTSAAVLVPDTVTRADLTAARRLSNHGVMLLGHPCPPSSLLHHTDRQLCGATRVLERVGIPVVPIVVSDDEIEALDLVVARRDGTRIVLPDRAFPGSHTVSTAKPGGGVWVVDRATSGEPAADLARTLRMLRRSASHLGLTLRPITSVRART